MRAGGDGSKSYGQLAQSAAGVLFGTCTYGGNGAQCNNCGTVWSWTPSSRSTGVFLLLQSLGNDNSFPLAVTLVGSQLFVLGEYGRHNNNQGVGTVFVMNSADGSNMHQVALFDLNNNGLVGRSTLLLATNGGFSAKNSLG